ncbi:MAG TPA: hypothetical protein VGP82_15740 [Ktedonobacterales bacterium]|nr:hypothetical protein [Ktedonobacterales bacterium]
MSRWTATWLGHTAGPYAELDWLFPTITSAQLEMVTEFLREVDTILLGRTTYLEQGASWPNQTGELADPLDTHSKVVFA